MTRPDLDAIRARCDAATPGPWRLKGLEIHGDSKPGRCGLLIYDEGGHDKKDARFIAHARTDIPALLAYIDMLEHMLSEERENVDTLRARVAELEARTTYTVGETEWAHRIAVAEQRFVDESDAHQETRKLLTDLYMKQLRADAAQMREYGISYHGMRSLFAEYDGGELSLGKVLELLRAAARELARDEIAELKARITTLEATR